MAPPGGKAPSLDRFQSRRPSDLLVSQRRLSGRHGAQLGTRKCERRIFESNFLYGNLFVRGGSIDGFLGLAGAPQSDPPSGGSITEREPLLYGCSKAFTLKGRDPSLNLPSSLSRNSLSGEEFARVDVNETEAELLSAFAQGLERTCSMELSVGVGAGVGIGEVAA